MNGHINGTSKQSYLQVAEDPRLRASYEWDIMEYMADQLTALYTKFDQQPEICGRKFIKRWHAYVFGGAILGLLVGLGIVEYDKIIELFM